MASTKRCRVGDLAIIVRGRKENIGLFVRVARVEGPEDSSDFDPQDPQWVVEAGRKSILVTYADDTTGREEEAAYCDDFLEPLRPPAPAVGIKVNVGMEAVHG